MEDGRQPIDQAGLQGALSRMLVSSAKEVGDHETVFRGTLEGREVLVRYDFLAMAGHIEPLEPEG